MTSETIDAVEAFNNICFGNNPSKWHDLLIKSGAEYSHDYKNSDPDDFDQFHYYAYPDQSSIILFQNGETEEVSYWETCYPPSENIVNLNQLKSENLIDYSDRLRGYRKELPLKTEDITVICDDQVKKMSSVNAIKCIDLSLKALAT